MALCAELLGLTGFGVGEERAGPIEHGLISVTGVDAASVTTACTTKSLNRLTHQEVQKEDEAMKRLPEITLPTLER